MKNLFEAELFYNYLPWKIYIQFSAFFSVSILLRLFFKYLHSKNIEPHCTLWIVYHKDNTRLPLWEGSESLLSLCNFINNFPYKFHQASSNFFTFVPLTFCSVALKHAESSRRQQQENWQSHPVPIETFSFSSIIFQPPRLVTKAAFKKKKLAPPLPKMKRQTFH